MYVLACRQLAYLHFLTYVTASGSPGDPTIFPHLYNDLCLGKDEVESVKIWQRNESGWDTAIESSKIEGWFVY